MDKHIFGFELRALLAAGLILVTARLPVRAAGCLTPSFGAAMTFGAGANPISVAVGDFNGDRMPDLAVANADSNDVSILLGSDRCS